MRASKPGHPPRTLYTRPPSTARADNYDLDGLQVEANEFDPAAPATDSRRRQDIRALEQGRVDDAHRLKQQIEAAQRTKLKAGHAPKPAFFAPVLDSAGVCVGWRYNGRYW